MTIPKELAQGVFPELSVTVSHETIYAGIYANGRVGLTKGLHRNLHRGCRCRKPRRPTGETLPVKTGPLGMFNLICTRPAVANGRREVGHLEGA